MSVNSDIVKNFYDVVINQKNLDAIGSFLSKNFIHNGESRGLEGQKQIIQRNFFNAFPDIKVNCEFFVNENDLVTVHNIWSGTHKGNFLGVSPTGKHVEWRANAILQIKDDKIIKAWDENDFLSLFMQLGEFPKI
ncbi:MAG: ester cyclase [Bacteroidetes bacterium]|nr:ester cyclase [Bacteroidota bacterium]